MVGLLTVTALVAIDHQKKLPDMMVTLIGTFWGFFLTQAGLLSYERAKEKREYVSMLVAARNELQMNKGTVYWIDYLIRKGLAEKEVHGAGFAGVDEISAAAAENLVHSPLTYKLSSREFSSHRLLSLYQTLLQYRREIPTDNVDGRIPVRYENIRFDVLLKSFEVLKDWVDREGIRIAGKRKWLKYTSPLKEPEHVIADVERSLESTERSIGQSQAEAGISRRGLLESDRQNDGVLFDELVVLFMSLLSAATSVIKIARSVGAGRKTPRRTNRRQPEDD